MKKIKNRDGDVSWSGRAASMLNAVECAIAAGVDLRFADLEYVDFRGAVFHDVDFTGANFRGACFRLTHLRGVKFAGATFADADLRGAYLKGANFRNADLKNANLCGAYLKGADLQGADLQGANLQLANIFPAMGPCANLTGARLPVLAGAPDPRELRRLVADHIEAHPDLHDQCHWGNGADEPSCKTPCCVAGWACHLGGGDRGLGVATAATLLLWVDGLPLPDFSKGASREDILAALRAR